MADETPYPTRTRLSESPIWEMMTDWYVAKGPEAWQPGGVPHRITNTTVMAQTYARLIARFAWDTGNKPLRIVELAAGHGRLGYQIIKKLLDIQETAPQGLPEFTYVMTDLAEDNVDAWRHHLAMQPLVEQGVLAFQQLDATAPTLDSLLPGELLVVVANYCFDSLPCDVWYVSKGELHECLVDLKPSKKSEGTPIQRHKLAWGTPTPDPGPWYEDDRFNQVLGQYTGRFEKTAITFPLGALTAMDGLNELTPGPMLVLSADKGYQLPTDIENRGLPGLVRHEGAFSFMMNFDAMAEFSKVLGGFCVTSNLRPRSLEITAFVTSGVRADYPQLVLGAQELLEQASPADDFALQRLDDVKKPSLAKCLATIRMSACDPDVVFKLRDPLRSGMHKASDSERNEMLRIAAEAWKLCLPVETHHDVPFDLGRILARSWHHEEAIEYFHRSLTHYGPHATTWFNIAACQKELQLIDEAIASLVQSLTLDPSFKKAQKLLDELELEL
jgi:tetratricopeptide (TPR) repeat protein